MSGLLWIVITVNCDSFDRTNADNLHCLNSINGNDILEMFYGGSAKYMEGDGESDGKADDL